MAVTSTRWFALLALGPALALLACRASSVPPHGEALFFVDTDLPVPALAGRLRVDLYSETGTWFESRDIGRSDPLDWPASFSVYSGDDTRDVRVLVRVRAYPEGAVRPYQGERYQPRTRYVEPRVATSIADLCAHAPELAIGGRLTARRGSSEITKLTPDASGHCTQPNAAGSIAARITVPGGTYRFDVAGSFPFVAETILSLRSRCEDPSSQLACDAEDQVVVTSAGHFPRFQSTLAQGTYWLVTGGTQANWPADVTIEALSVDDPQAAGAEAPDVPAPTSSFVPRLHPVDPSGGVTIDPTPPTEPEPSAAVDRLVLVKLSPGVRGAARITLHGVCAGTMAKLGADPRSPDATSAQSCVEAEGVTTALTELSLDPDLTTIAPSIHDTFGLSEPCGADASNASVACIPGGAFLLGGRAANPLAAPLYLAAPERLALMHRFYLDRNEVTVAQMRAASAGGLPTDSDSLVVNDGALCPVVGCGGPGFSAGSSCVYTSTPMAREDFSVSCVAWRLARAYCQLRGGDLPTEAQWEYAASAAGRPFKTLYAWGDDPATCDRAVYGRGGTQQRGGTDCATALATSFAPAPTVAGKGDVTPLGVRSMMGGLTEWTLDSAAPYDGECWRGAELTNPRCWEENAPFRSMRGASWLDGQIAPATVRSALPGEYGGGSFAQRPAFISEHTVSSGVGFRCAYPEQPK